jgi:hypothetical protein
VIHGLSPAQARQQGRQLGFLDWQLNEPSGKIFGGAMHKMRQDVAVHLFAHHKTACLLTLSPLACHEAACSEPVKRRFISWSGRRGSNPRQPAWEAGTLPLSYSRMWLCYHMFIELSIPFLAIWQGSAYLWVMTRTTRARSIGPLRPIYNHPQACRAFGNSCQSSNPASRPEKGTSIMMMEVSFISNLSVLPLQLLLHTAHVASDSFDAQQTN